MQLTFEYTQNLGGGSSPNIAHMKDNKLYLIYLDENGTVSGKIADPVMGLYNNLQFQNIGRISNDRNVTNPAIKKVSHYGVYGFWSGEGDHRFVMFMLPTDISDSILDGSLNYSIGSEVSQFSATFINKQQKLLNRYHAVLTPNTELDISYTIGDQKLSLGHFFIDRASCSYPENKISISARNTIGKLLKEQYFDEDKEFIKATLQDNLKDILTLAGIEKSFVASNVKPWRLTFDPQLSLFDGIKKIVQQLPKWKIEETLDGTVGIGPISDTRFEQPGVFTFYRDKTCFSYQVEYDDSESFSRVCIKCNDPENVVYSSIVFPVWWIPPRKRTMYVEVVDGTSLEEMKMIADEIAASVAISGRMESFAAIFTPQLILGDEVKMVDESAKKETIGIVTDIRHQFSKSGYTTEFTVDSGGRKGKSRLSDFINKLNKNQDTSGIKIY